MPENRGTPASASIVSAPAPAPEPILPKPGRLAEAEKRIRRLHGENLATPSILGMLNGIDQEGVSEPEARSAKGKVSLKEQHFEQDQLIKGWKDFANTVEAGQLKSALSVRDPFLLDNYVIEYNLDNEVQRQRIVVDLKPKLLAYLHKVLNNERISIEFNVVENQEEILNKPYTDQEKFNALLAKYPLLGIMKQRFGLDFE